jgi:hypothetical protein
LVDKYLESFVSCEDMLKDRITIINKNHSAIFLYNNNPVGAVIRNAARANVSKHFGLKIQSVVKDHYSIKRGEKHTGIGTMVAYGTRPDFFDKRPGPYAYQNKNLGPDAQKIIDQNESTLANWLYDYGREHLPFATVSYDQFKEKVKLNDDQVIGTVFCTKNYQAVGHRDDDRSEFAIGYVYDTGIVNGRCFFYPEYSAAIELASNSIWCWKTDAVHGTAKLDSKGEDQYTAVVTLNKATARAIEKDINKKI